MRAISQPELVVVERPLGAARITAVEAVPVSLPLRTPIRFASGTIDRADNVLVRIHTDAGLTGTAEAQPRPYTYGETQRSIVDTVTGRLGPRLLGADPSDRAAARAVAQELAGQLCARAAVDVALWDLTGRLAGVSCVELLGGGEDREVRVASMISFGEPEAMAEEAVALHEAHGIAAFKVKVGRTPALDVAAVERIRAALPEAELYVDANRGWTLEQALEAGEALLALGVTAIEEPLDLEDRDGRRLLADRWPVPLAGDESCLTLAQVRRELADGAVGQVSVKVARTGFSESVDVLAHCRQSGVPAVLASQYEGALGAWSTVTLGAASPQVAGRPVEAANFLDLAADLLPGPAIREGRVAPSTAAGLGVALDEELLAAYRVDR